MLRYFLNGSVAQSTMRPHSLKNAVPDAPYNNTSIFILVKGQAFSMYNYLNNYLNDQVLSLVFSDKAKRLFVSKHT